MKIGRFQWHISWWPPHVEGMSDGSGEENARWHVFLNQPFFGTRFVIAFYW